MEPKKSKNPMVLEKFLDSIENNLQNVGKDDTRYALCNSIKRYCNLLRVEFLIDDRKGIKEKFKKTVDQRRTALLFGAGISMGLPFGLPNWSKLLQYVIVGEFLDNYEVEPEENFDKIIKTLTDKKKSGDYFGSFDLYELGQFLENCRAERNRNETKSVSEIKRRTDNETYYFIKKGLLHNIETDLQQAKSGQKKNEEVYWQENDEYYKLKPTKDSNFESSLIARICKFVKDQEAKRIITYNYDNAFEYAYAHKYKDACEIKPIFVDTQLPTAETDEKLPIYHVHGYIHMFDDGLPDAEFSKLLNTDESKQLVLSESSYDDMARSSYKWRNTVQIDTFLRYNCIFFGFSATDINFKRIVKLMDWHNEYAAGVKTDVPPVNHFIFMTVDDYIKNIFGDWIQKSKNNNILLNKFKTLDKKLLSKLDAGLKFLYFTLRLKRKYLKKLHIYPIWTTIYQSECYLDTLFQ